MSKIDLHCSFGHLKHNLWPNERPGVKLSVSLLTRKSRESTRFTYLHTTCDIFLEKLLTRATTLLETIPRFEVCSQSYWALKSQESWLAQF